MGTARFVHSDKMLSGKSGVWLEGDALDDVAPPSRPGLVAAGSFGARFSKQAEPNFIFSPELTGFALYKNSTFACIWGSLECVSLH